MSDLQSEQVSVPAPLHRRLLADRFIDTIEMIAAIFVGVVAADVFI
jgi:hypothetical protein